jgi:hypothetical protein
MAKDEDAKRRIISELEKARLELAETAAIVKDRLDIPARVSASIRRYSWSWVSLAAIRLKGEEKRPERERDLAWIIWDGVWSLAKPLLTAYLGRKLAQATGNSHWRKG